MSVADIRSQSEERNLTAELQSVMQAVRVSCGYTLSIRRAEPHRLTTVSHAGSHVSCGYTLSIRRAEPHRLTTVSHSVGIVGNHRRHRHSRHSSRTRLFAADNPSKTTPERVGSRLLDSLASAVAAVNPYRGVDCPVQLTVLGKVASQLS